MTLLVSRVFLQEPYIKHYQITYWSDARVSTNFWPCSIFSIKNNWPIVLCWPLSSLSLLLCYQTSLPSCPLVYAQTSFPVQQPSIPLSLSLLYCPSAHGGLLQQIILHNNMEGLHNKLHLFTAVKDTAIKIIVSLQSVTRALLTALWTFWKQALMREFVYSVPLYVTGVLQIVCLQLCDEFLTKRFCRVMQARFYHAVKWGSWNQMHFLTKRLTQQHMRKCVTRFLSGQDKMPALHQMSSWIM